MAEEKDEKVWDDNVRHGIDNDPKNDTTKGAVLGGVGGAVTGAVAGSMMGPAGAAIGGAVGAVVGAAGSGAAVNAVDRVDDDNTVTGIRSGHDANDPDHYRRDTTDTDYDQDNYDTT